ncbi:phenylalanine--tRNA ligase subunit beta [Actinotalea sp. M2MS4P-6]|uniref:phenylalanine--tRNA ligase subunit beta n=1 Tax=Actinotalea sp. M2MS4P-6 TaxID=2983762 RepID=UPI0021E3A0D4|nr:phenylalanine--tRNA ligase subunit beta [Actinotalea sp. M2MS4P-6]MCV2393386.1 phenylalanine--tRNA ligase subunit beta [Actinotalea sp. M2MS4P-6]
MPRIPLTWLGEHVALRPGTTAETLAADLVKVGLEEEEIHGAQVTGPLVVGRVLTEVGEPQKNGKTIHWCTVDVGPQHNEANPVDPAGPPSRGIICGAHNFGAGDLVVVALPGTTLPGGFHITARKTYGHVSDGMICSVRELGIGDDHTGILVLDDDVMARYGMDPAAVVPGADARTLLGLADEVLEINVTPDRGYCFSMRGVAREYSHSTGAEFTDPALPTAADLAPAPGGFAVEPADEAPIHGVPGCDRFVAQVVRGVDPTRPSPGWMQRRLTQAGMRPISLAVDVTNYVMLDLGQPLHAYDLASLVAPIVVRRAAPGETLTTLDDVTRRLDPEDLLITDSAGGHGSRILGLAGVMGGAETEVTAVTTDLLIEGAHFDPITVARTSRRHKLPSEAAKRFERGVDPQLQRVAVRRCAELITTYGGGQITDELTDVGSPVEQVTITLPLDLPERVVGVAYTADEVLGTLRALGCGLGEVRAEGGRDVVDATVPSWRPDLQMPVDLVEEVARLTGYDRIGSVLPTAPAGRGFTHAQRMRRRVADALADAGLVETLSYPFVGAAEMDALGWPAEDPRRRTVRLVNPLAETQPELRTAVLLTLGQTARRNVSRGQSDLAIFEVGLVTVADGAAAEAPTGGVYPGDDVVAKIRAAVPTQPRHVAGVLAGRREPAGWWGAGRPADHTDAIEAVRLVARTVGAAVEVRAADAMPWHPGRCAEVLVDGRVIGHAGELHPSVVGALDLPPRAVAFEVDLDALIDAAPDAPRQAVPVSTFPLAKEDLAFVVDASVTAAELTEAVRTGATTSVAGDVLEDLRLFDVYTGAQLGTGTKSLAFALRLRAADRTLTNDEIVAVRESAVAEAARRCGAVLRS